MKSSSKKASQNPFYAAMLQARRHNTAQPNSYSEGLFDVSWSYYLPEEEQEELPVPDKTAPEKENAPVVEKQVTEKTKILDSLQDFARKQFDDGDKDSIHFPGGELAKKAASFQLFEGVEPKLLDDSGVRVLSEKIDKTFSKLKFSASPKTPLKAMFVVECSEDVRSLSDKEMALEASFETPAAILFDKMIKAMKLGDGDYLVTSFSALKDGQRVSFEKSLCQEIYHYRPRIVFSLGGGATASFLGKEERLQKTHGQFFEKEIKSSDGQGHTFEVMPLFSPAFLVEAPNSKRIAWEDMQKAMRKME